MSHPFLYYLWRRLGDHVPTDQVAENITVKPDSHLSRVSCRVDQIVLWLDITHVPNNQVVTEYINWLLLNNIGYQLWT